MRQLDDIQLLTVLYARVSSHDQRADLDRQKLRLLEHAQRKHMHINQIVAEIGSGLNGTRPKLLKSLLKPATRLPPCRAPDRLARFGFEMVDALLRARGGGVIVIEEREVDDDLVRDMTEVLTSLCARLYGRRSAQRRAEACGEATQE